MAMMAGSGIGSGDGNVAGNVADGGNAGGYPLRRWQRECLRAWVRAGRRGIVDVATGAGKTALALAAVKEAEARTEGGQMRVRVIVPKVFLARQWLTDIMAQLGIRRGEIGICSGELREPDRRVTIYVLNTARTAVSKHILDDLRAGRSVFLICDECHHMASSENARVFGFLPYLDAAARTRYFSIGLSATPQTENFQEVLVPALGHIVYRYALDDAAREQIISRYALHSVALDFTPDEAEAYREFSDKISTVAGRLYRKVPGFARLDKTWFFTRVFRHSFADAEIARLVETLRILLFQRKELVNLASARVFCVCEILGRLPRGSRVLVFTERIAMADELYARLEEVRPGKVRRYHSGVSPEARRRAIEAYREREVSVLVCCQALDEGLNVPDTDVGIIASATSSPRQRIQRLGRILRLSRDTDEKNIYHLYVAASSEDSMLLPSLATTGSMTYDYRTGAVSHPEYDALADRMMEKLLTRGATPAEADEVQRNVRLGAIRADFRRPEKICVERAARAQTTRERNYWETMRLLAREAAAARKTT